MKRKVLCLTAIRSEYYLQKPIYTAIQNHKDLELELVVSGAHLSPIHGYTVKNIEEDGFYISERIESLLYSDRDASRIKSAAHQLQILSHIIDSRRPDWLLAVGDREEPMLMALCGAYMNIPVMHYAAGDRVVGNVDDMIRHSISRLAHMMLTTSEDSRRRLIQSGEEEWRVHNVGHSGLDRIRTTPVIEPAVLSEQLGIPGIDKPYLIIIYHSLSSEINRSEDEITSILSAIAEMNIQAFVSYPNSDAGAHKIIQVIERYRSSPNIHVFKNIPDTQFVNLLRGAAMLVGNSSLGLLEAPYLKLPVINVGKRQMARIHSENVFFIESDQKKIIDQINGILYDKEIQKRVKNCSNPFGDGQSAERISHYLADIKIDNKLMNKDLTF